MDDCALRVLPSLFFFLFLSSQGLRRVFGHMSLSQISESIMDNGSHSSLPFFLPPFSFPLSVDVSDPKASALVSSHGTFPSFPLPLFSSHRSIQVLDKSNRTDGTFSRSDFVFRRFPPPISPFLPLFFQGGTAAYTDQSKSDWPRADASFPFSFFDEY